MELFLQVTKVGGSKELKSIRERGWKLRKKEYDQYSKIEKILSKIKKDSIDDPELNEYRDQAKEYIKRNRDSYDKIYYKFITEPKLLSDIENLERN